MDAICVLFLLCSQSKSSCWSVLLDFSASLSDVAPVSSILLSVDLMGIEKSGLLMNVIYVLFHLCSRCRLSLASVVFDFNASLNDFTPVSPMSLTVDLMRMEKGELLMDLICMLFFVFTF